MADDTDIAIKFDTIGTPKVLSDVSKQRAAFQSLSNQLSATSSLVTVLGFNMGGTAGQMSLFVDSALAASGAATKLAKSLKELSLLRLSIAGFAIAGLVAGGMMVAKAIQAVKDEAAAKGSLAEQTIRLSQSLGEEINAREKAGRLSKMEADVLRDQLQSMTSMLFLMRDAGDTQGLNNAAKGIIKISEALNIATGKDTSKLRDAERVLTLADLDARLEMTRAHAELQQQLDENATIENLEQLQDSIFRRQQIIDKSHEAERKLLDEQLFVLTQKKAESFHEDEQMLIEAEIVQQRARIKALDERKRTQEAALVGFNNEEVLRLRQEGNRRELLDLQSQLSVKRDTLAVERSLVEADFTLTNVEKRQKLLDIAIREKEVLDEQVKLLRQRRDLLTPGDVRGRQQLEQDILGAEGEARSAGGSLAALGASADPESFRQQMSLTITTLQDQMGTTAQIIARSFSTVIGSAVDGIASSISGLLNLTMSWGDALRNIGTSIIQGIIQSFAQMVAEWIVSHVIMKGVLLAFSLFGIALKTKETATTIAMETSKTPVLAMNAGLASVSSYGAAAYIGLAALLAAVAVMAAMSFDRGGYTGSMGRTEPAGIVHGQEFVVNADATRRIGVGTLEAINAGSEIPASSGGGGGGMTLVVVDSRKKADDLDAPQGRKKVVEIMGEEMHNFRL